MSIFEDYIVQYNLSSKEVIAFKTLEQYEDDGFDLNKIIKVCDGNKSHYKQYGFSYFNDFEIWVDYDNIMVSSFGRVWSPRIGIHNGTNHSRGYKCVNVNCINTLVHRIVAQVFLSKDEHQTQINHKDGNKANNHVSNLEWCTPKENIQHGIRTGLINPTGPKTRRPKKVVVPRGRLIGQYTLEGDLIETYFNDQSKMLRNNLIPQSVSNCANGRIKTHRGYIFRYID